MHASSPLPLALLALLASLGLPQPVAAQTHPAPAKPAARPSVDGPKSIGKWEDWQAATYQEAGQPVCYAFTRATTSLPRLPGRGDVVLTVTQRHSGRDAVALSAGFAYAPNAEVQVQVDQTTLAFYTAGRSAFAREGKAAVTAFEKGAKAVAQSPGPRAAAVADSFSLRGFTAAYAAINKACPAK